MLGLSRTSLKQLLTFPYVILVITAAGVIGLLSYNAGRDAVDTLSNHVLSETVSRIAQAIDSHVAGSEAVLETAFPTDVPPSTSVADDLEALRTRFWLATTIHRIPNNYAYYGDRNGQFIGLYRFSETEAELRLRTDGVSPRKVYRYSRINGELGNAVEEERIFEPRERPWYKAGQETTNQTWTSIYIDFKTLELVSTRARRVDNAAGEFQGVVATDLSLELLNDFLKSLKLTPNGFAFIVEPDGKLVATSRGPHIRRGIDDANTRLNAADSDDPLLAATYQSVRDLTVQAGDFTAPLTGFFEGPNGDTIQTGYRRLRDNAGLDWIIAVAVPRDDFMHQVTQNVRKTAALALLACLLIIAIGLIVLNLISRDLRQLSQAASALGDGSLDSSMPAVKIAEIGDLAKSFSSMRRRVLTDRLTGIPNREAVTRRIEDRIFKRRRRGDDKPFAVLFVDLNGFKRINDHLGHEVGDQVLMAVGQRLNSRIRAGDFAGRYGGDEFVVLINEVSNRKDAEAARDNLEDVLRMPFQFLLDMGPQASALAPSAAIGLALCPDDGNDLDALLKRADEEMYRRKRHESLTPQI